MEQINVIGRGKAENNEDSITVRIKAPHLDARYLYYEIVPGGIKIVSELDGSMVRIGLMDFMGYGFKTINKIHGVFRKKRKKLRFKSDDK